MDGKEIIKEAIKEVLSGIDENEQPLGWAFIKALDQYTDLGYKLSDLSWFKGTIIEDFENNSAANEKTAA